MASYCFAAPPTALPTPPVVATSHPVDLSYRIATGDTVTIEVLNKPQLTRTVMILPDGKITYPYVGEVQAAGLTVAGLSDAVRDGLSKQLNNPQVTVNVVQRRERRVGVLGAVRQTGNFPLDDGWRVLDLILAAGGLSVEKPEWVQATLVRGPSGNSAPIDLVRLMSTGDAEVNQVLEPGDILLVQEKDPSKTRVQVLGAVRKPGLVPAPLDGSLLTAINAAGGIAPRAKGAEASIRRDGMNIPVDLTAMAEDGTIKTAAGTAPVMLKPGDTLVIPINALSYSVIGAVAQPGTREFPDKQKLTAAAALLQAGGASASADLKNAALVRMSPEGNAIVTPINLEKYLKHDTKAVATDRSSSELETVLQPGDVLFLPSRGQKQDRMSGVRNALSVLPFVGLFMR